MRIERRGIPNKLQQQQQQQNLSPKTFSVGNKSSTDQSGSTTYISTILFHQKSYFLQPP